MKINGNKLNSDNLKRKMGAILLGISLMMGFVSINNYKSGAAILPEKELNTYLDSAFRNLKVPGGAVILMDRDETRFYFYGEDGKKPVDKDTPFLIGSFSESMTALGILKLLDEGKITVDSKIIELLPEFADSNPYTSSVTVRELLSHTSGISKNSGYRYSNLSLTGKDSIAKALAAVKRLTIGEKKFEESNLNYLILGGIIEKVSGTDFSSFMKENIFLPLGMDSTYAGKEEAAARGMEKGFRSFLGIIYRSNLLYDDAGVPYGYITSTPGDLEKYLRFMISPQGAPVISNEIKSNLRTPLYTKDFRNNYGLGYNMINPGTAEAEYISDGLMGDYNSQFDIMPLKEEAIGILVNKGHALQSKNLELLRDRLKKTLAGDVPQPIPSHIPFMEYITAAVTLLAAAGLIIRYGRRKKKHDFAPVDYISSAIQIILGFSLFPLIKAIFGYPLNVMGILAPDISLLVFVLSILLVLHGLLTLYKAFFLDRGRKLLPLAFFPPKKGSGNTSGNKSDNVKTRKKKRTRVKVIKSKGNDTEKIHEKPKDSELSVHGEERKKDLKTAENPADTLIDDSISITEEAQDTKKEINPSVPGEKTKDQEEEHIRAEEIKPETHESVSSEDKINHGEDDPVLSYENYVYRKDESDDEEFISGNFLKELPPSELPLDNSGSQSEPEKDENEKPVESDIIRRLREKLGDRPSEN